MVGRSVADFLSLPIHRAATAEQEDARGNSREPLLSSYPARFATRQMLRDFEARPKAAPLRLITSGD